MMSIGVFLKKDTTFWGIYSLPKLPKIWGILLLFFPIYGEKLTWTARKRLREKKRIEKAKAAQYAKKKGVMIGIPLSKVKAGFGKLLKHNKPLLPRIEAVERSFYQKKRPPQGRSNRSFCPNFPWYIIEKIPPAIKKTGACLDCFLKCFLIKIQAYHRTFLPRYNGLCLKNNASTSDQRKKTPPPLKKNSPKKIIIKKKNARQRHLLIDKKESPSALQKKSPPHAAQKIPLLIREKRDQKKEFSPAPDQIDDLLLDQKKTNQQKITDPLTPPTFLQHLCPASPDETKRTKCLIKKEAPTPDPPDKKDKNKQIVAIDLTSQKHQKSIKSTKIAPILSLNGAPTWSDRAEGSLRHPLNKYQGRGFSIMAKGIALVWLSIVLWSLWHHGLLFEIPMGLFQGLFSWGMLSLSLWIILMTLSAFSIYRLLSAIPGISNLFSKMIGVIFGIFLWNIRDYYFSFWGAGIDYQIYHAFEQVKKSLILCTITLMPSLLFYGSFYGSVRLWGMPPDFAFLALLPITCQCLFWALSTIDRLGKNIRKLRSKNAYLWQLFSDEKKLFFSKSPLFQGIFWGIVWLPLIFLMYQSIRAPYQEIKKIHEGKEKKLCPDDFDDPELKALAKRHAAVVDYLDFPDPPNAD